jgi:hypothetical protein
VLTTFDMVAIFAIVMLIPNDSGSVSIFGATIAYGTWFWWVAGIAVISLLLAIVLYLVGRRTAAQAEPALAGSGGAPGADG